jgi:hypothetical protein
MATLAKPLFRGAATTSTGTVLYTTPASTTTVVSNIAITNTAGTSATFTMALATVALHTTTTIAANSTIYIDLKQAITATQTITGGASAVTVSFHISGVEIS